MSIAFRIEQASEIDSTNDEAAFRILIDRDGPMVLGVCRSVLNASHDAEDAFQTTFLVLVKNAGTIRNSDSLGPWLHQVALRTASYARVSAARRRRHESKAAEAAAVVARQDSAGGGSVIVALSA